MPRLALFRRKGTQLAVALLTEPTIKHAAKVAGVDLTTVYQWALLPEFQAELRRARDELRAELVKAAVEAGKQEVAKPIVFRALGEGPPEQQTPFTPRRRVLERARAEAQAACAPSEGG